MNVAFTIPSELSAAHSETEVHWREFLVSLKERGVGIPDSITSNMHKGSRAALKAAFKSDSLAHAEAMIAALH